MSYRRLIHTCLKLYPFTTWFRDLIYFLTKLVELVSLIRIDSLPYSNNKLCLTSSFFSSEPYLNGSLCGETILFLFWIYLTFVIFVLDLLPHVYSLCAWVYLFYYQWILITYQKKTLPQVLKWSRIRTPILSTCFNIYIYIYILIGNQKVNINDKKIREKYKMFMMMNKKKKKRAHSTTKRG